jgi:chemotaxis protein methyltransferase CheR
MTEISRIAAAKISAQNFEFLCQTIYDDSGIVLDEAKMYLVQARLVPVVKSEGLDTLDSLCNLIRSTGGRRVRDHVVDAMTTNETLFFRDGRPFDALRQTLIPEITSRRSDEVLRVWSAACSTGQEAYSISMIWRELNIPEWQLRLLATDLSETVLQHARLGKYHQHEVKRGLSPDYLAKYFEQDATEWTIRPEIRQMVQWQKFNLRDSMSTMEPFDIILCRNVLIYFDDETKGRIIENLRASLKPGGYLLLGSTETTLKVNVGFNRIKVGLTVAYQNMPSDE